MTHVYAPHDASYKIYGTKKVWSNPATTPITEAQQNYLLNVLLKDKVMPAVQRVKYIAEVPTYTKSQASALITTLKALPWKTKAEKAAESTNTSVIVDAILESEAPKVVQGQGFYQDGAGKVYAYLFNAKKGFPVWKKLVEKTFFEWDGAEYVEKKKGSYVKVSSYYAKTNIEAGGKKLTMAEVKAHGHLMGYCLCCGKLLSDPKSVEAKIGPVCVKNFGAMLGLL